MSSWDVFLYNWRVVAWYAAWHHSWRQRGHKVYFNENGTVIYHPKAISYLDGF